MSIEKMKTAIEWCHITANFWHGCYKNDIVCQNCYAADWIYTNAVWGKNKPRLAIKPLARKKSSEGK